MRSLELAVTGFTNVLTGQAITFGLTLYIICLGFWERIDPLGTVTVKVSNLYLLNKGYM
jgi:hypothetical protein